MEKRIKIIFNKDDKSVTISDSKEKNININYSDKKISSKELFELMEYDTSNTYKVEELEGVEGISDKEKDYINDIYLLVSEIVKSLGELNTGAEKLS